VSAVWWTAADDAELDTLAYELVRCVWDHREGCAACLAHDECERLREGLRDALDAIMDWKQARALRSKALWLRHREEAA
jgi:hypothetical protein